MKQDMQKILLDRARVAHHYSSLSKRGLRKQRNTYRRSKKFKIDEYGDVCDLFSSAILPMRSRKLGYDINMFDLNFVALRRYLQSRIGQSWNDTYSEICTHLSSNSRKNNDIMIHLKWEVVEHTIRSGDGRVWAWGIYHQPCDHKGEFFVEPETGLLRAGHIQRKRNYPTW